MKITRAQTILAYAVLILFVVSALIAMSGYLKRRIQGSYKQAGDAFGQEEVD